MDSNRNKHHLGVRKISEAKDSENISIQVAEQSSSTCYTIDSILGKTDVERNGKDVERESLCSPNTGK